MTKTKKILTVALAAILVAAAVFFAIFPSIYGKFDYAKHAKSSVSLSLGEYLGLAVTADDTELEAPTDDDVRAAIAEVLYKYREESESSTASSKKYVEHKDKEIGLFDALYINYLGWYMDGNEKVYFTSGENMAKSKLPTLLIGAGSYNKGELKALSDAMIDPDNSILGKKPADYKYSVVDKAEGATDILVPAEGPVVVYIDYSWIRYTVTGEGESKVRTPAGGSGDDKNLVHEDLRVDLTDVPDIFPDDLASKIYGAKVGTANPIKFTSTMSVTENEVTTEYEYDYTVIVNFVIDEWTPFTVEYTYPADSEEKDIYGNELKGKAVTFEVVVDYFHNVPELTDQFENDNSEQESIVTHNKYLNLDAKTDFYPVNPAEGDRKLLSKDDWDALEGEKAASYEAYLADEYTAYQKHTLEEKYNDSRMYVAADEIWKNIVAKAQISYPKRAVKLAYEERLDYYEYSYNEGTSKVNGKSQSNRSLYKNVGAYIEAAYKAEMKEKGVTTWKAFVEAEAKESVAQTLLVYYLYQTLDLTYDKEAYAGIENMAVLYQLYGYGSFTKNQIKEAAMFDCVMEHLYKNAQVTWKSELPAEDAE